MSESNDWVRPEIGDTKAGAPDVYSQCFDQLAAAGDLCRDYLGSNLGVVVENDAEPVERENLRIFKYRTAHPSILLIIFRNTPTRRPYGPLMIMALIFAVCFVQDALVHRTAHVNRNATRSDLDLCPQCHSKGACEAHNPDRALREHLTM